LLIGCSVLVPDVAQIVAASGFVLEEQFGSWARVQCNTFFARLKKRSSS